MVIEMIDFTRLRGWKRVAVSNVEMRGEEQDKMGNRKEGGNVSACDAQRVLRFQVRPDEL